MQENISEIVKTIEALPLKEKIEALNDIREALHKVSPFKSEPVDFVRWVPSGVVEKNHYNPNSVAPPEMELLRTSINNDGYCVEASTPILCADMTWKPAGSLEVGQEIISFDEYPINGPTDRNGSRRFRTGKVTYNRVQSSPLVKVTTTKGEILCTPDHPWLSRPMNGSLQHRKTHWVEAQDLRKGDLVFKFFETWDFDQSREAGWLAGFLDGEGTMAVNVCRNGRSVHRLAGYQKPGPTADRMGFEITSRVDAKFFTVDRSSHPKWNSMVMCRVDRFQEIIKLLGSVRPERLIEDAGRFWEGRSITFPGNNAEVISVEVVEDGLIASMATSTRTYIADGFAMHNTQPIVGNQEDDKIIVVDGFHRHRVGKECLEINARIHNYLPVVQIRSEQVSQSDRMASTVRHNRARGKHKVEAMSDMVIELKRRNWSDEKICKELGMDRDEVLRLCQISGLSEIFSGQEFSKAWEPEGHFTPEDYEDISGDAADYVSEEITVKTANTDDENRIFHTFDKWECNKAGFYETKPPKGMTADNCKAYYRDLLTNIPEFEYVLEGVITEWKNSCEHYLTNSAMNRIAWLGQASLCYKHGIPSEFRGGYGLLTEAQQLAADEAALRALNRWLVRNGREALEMPDANPNRQSDIY